MPPLPELFLHSRRAKHFDRHPWVLAHSVVQPTAELPAGQVVDLMHPSGNWLARGIYNPHSKIRLRLYQWDRALELGSAWIESQLQQASAMRRQWMNAHHDLDALRWVNSEGDGLSGLIVDQFGDYVIVHVTSLAMWTWLDTIRGWLVRELQPAGICVRVDQGTATREGLEASEQWLDGQAPQEPITIVEHGVRFQLDILSGQKTGYYLDQRANRGRSAKWITEGPLLDVCCYQGGFSLVACQLGAPTSVEAVDSSRPALELAERNAQANQRDIDFVQADCFDYLEHLVQQGKQYQTVVLDPPRMASSRQQVRAALRAYFRLNSAAVRLLQPGGTLVTCSCTGRVKKSDLVGILAAIAAQTGRQLQILESNGADFDHPIDVNCPESEYLKCLICRVI